MNKKALLITHIRSMRTLLDNALKEYKGQCPFSFKSDVKNLRLQLVEMELIVVNMECFGVKNE